MSIATPRGHSCRRRGLSLVLALLALFALLLPTGTARAAAGDVDLTFDPGGGPDSVVRALAVQADGKVAIGGNFTSVNGTPRNNIARLRGDLLVAWAADDSAAKTVALPIVDDALVEADETVTLTLRPLGGGAIGGTPATLTLTIVDNDDTAPSATPQAVNGLEDAGLPITLAGSDVEGDRLSYTIASLPTAGTLYQANPGGTRGSPIASVPAAVANAAHMVIFAPAADANGAAYASFTFTVNDGRSDSPAATATIAITPVNDAPSFSPGANQTVAATAGAQTVVGWASGFTPGSADEAG